MKNGIVILDQYLDYLQHPSTSTKIFLLFKRALDITVASAALLILSPLMLITALAIALESHGGVLFAQTRVGYRGQHFTMWKFRSMNSINTASQTVLENQQTVSGGVRFKMKDDPRITTVGKIIRRLSIDELPQLLNVLIGDMSLVGPRPALPKEVAAYTYWHRLRLEAKPGITCSWQVSGRSNIPFEQQVELDVEYIRNVSFGLDCLLLLKTIPAVLTMRGAH